MRRAPSKIRQEQTLAGSPGMGRPRIRLLALVEKLLGSCFLCPSCLECLPRQESPIVSIAGMREISAMRRYEALSERSWIGRNAQIIPVGPNARAVET